MKRILVCMLAGLAVMGSAIGCAVDTAPVDEALFEDSLEEATVVRYSDTDLRELPEGKELLLDLTLPRTGYVIEYVDASLLSRVRVKSAKEEYLLAERIVELGLASTGTPSRIVLADDPDLQNDIAAGASVPEAQGQRIYICNECHRHGTIIHCTGCVALN